jgi:hypothetical protein
VRLPFPRGGNAPVMTRTTTAETATSVEERPLAEYATLTSSFWAVFTLFLLLAGRRIPDRLPAGDVLRIALASYKMSRVVAKDEVTAFLRAPVTEDPEAQEPKKQGMAAVLGELVTCPYCLGLWFSSALAYGHVLAPRQARFATAIFCMP